MTINANQLVDIQSRVIGAGLAGIEMNSVFLSESASIPANTPVVFTTLESVGEFFGLSSEEYKLATKYFLADDNKQKSPSALYFYRYISTAVAGWLRGGSAVASINEIKAIDNGSLAIKIDGVEKTYDSLDFTSATSYSAIAEVIQTALSTDATIEYNSTFKCFVITSATTGAESSVEFATSSATGTDLADVLCLTAATGALESAGSDAQTSAENMTNLVKKLKNFVSFLPVFNETSEVRQALAEWTNAQGTRFVYLANDTSATALTPNSECFAKSVKDYYGIFCGYNTKDFLAFVAGFIASIDWSRTNGRKTLAYKSQAGLEPTVIEDEDAIALLVNGYNFYGAYATASEEFSLAQNGSISGNAKWLDTYLGQIWVKTSLQASWLTVEKNANTLPFNDRGYDAFYAGSLDTINQAKDAGIVVAGVTLSNAQKSKVNEEAGLDISETLYIQGWYMQIPDADAVTRQNRGPIKPNLWYCDGGSIQKVDGNSNTIL